MPRLLHINLVAALALSFAPLSWCQDNTPHIDTGSTQMMRSADLKFAIEASQGATGEIELGQLAAQRAIDPDVKAFGRQMIDDHRKANEALKGLAARKNLTLPEALDAKDQATKTKLEGLTGVKFDKAYVKAMVKEHRDDVKGFQKEVKAGKDPHIKEFASAALPVVQIHLAKIKSIAGAMKSKR
jgi:putative membrane protein